MVERLNGVQEVVGSNPASPTSKIPKPKFQIPRKLQIQNPNILCCPLLIGVWCLGFPWSLELGIWDFFPRLTKRSELCNLVSIALISAPMLSAGIVGLPNVGKSTLFNAVTRTHKAPAENYPFCTIDPNLGVVTVPDPRLGNLSELSHSQKIIPAAIEFVDIAGLVKGASAGEGLGNQFLSHIREVDAIVQVVRCFENSDIHHVSGTIDPVRDIEVINTELVLADLASLQKRHDRLQKEVRAGSKTAKAENAVMEKVIAAPRFRKAGDHD